MLEKIERSKEPSTIYKQVDFEVDDQKLYKGSVQWFNVKKGFGYIILDDSYGIFVHQSNILKNNPKKFKRSLNDNEKVEFNIRKVDYVDKSKNQIIGYEAFNVTGPNNSAVVGK